MGDVLPHKLVISGDVIEVVFLKGYPASLHIARHPVIPC